MVRGEGNFEIFGGFHPPPLEPRLTFLFKYLSIFSFSRPSFGCDWAKHLFTCNILFQSPKMVKSIVVSWCLQKIVLKLILCFIFVIYAF